MKRTMKKIIGGAAYTLEWGRVFRQVEGLNNKSITPVFILGVPIHNNIGDLAIAYSEVEFINSIDGYSAVPISLPALNFNRNNLEKIIRPEHIIAGHGGGNMGDTYPEEEDIRRHIISKYPNNKIFIFPQTIYFSDSDFGKRFKDETISVYDKHKDLTIIAREGVSFESEKPSFSKNKVILTPDIVLSQPDLSDDSIERNGVLLCLRADVEKVLKESDFDKIFGLAKSISDKVTITDTVAHEKMFFFMNKTGVVKRKWQQFKGAELVITDRLHGMVFAAITGTPCIVFSNFNHKVRGTYEWIKDLDYIYYCNSVADLKNIDLEKLLNSNKKHDPAKYEKYWRKIRALIES